MPLVNRNSGGAWKKSRFKVLAGQTYDADTIPFNVFKGVEYIIHASNEVEDVYYTKHILSTKAKGSIIKTTIFGQVQDPLNLNLEVLIDGADAKMRLINNEAFDLDIGLAKLITS